MRRTTKKSILLTKYLTQQHYRNRILALYSMGIREAVMEQVLEQFASFCETERFRLAVCTEREWEQEREKEHDLLILRSTYPKSMKADRNLILMDDQDAHLNYLAALLGNPDAKGSYTILFSVPAQKKRRMYDLLEDYAAYALPLSKKQIREVLSL